MRARSSAVSAASTLERAGVAADLLDRGRVLEHLRRRAVELDDQHRAGARRVAGCDRGLDRLERERVHHLDRRRQDPGRDDVRDRIARGVGRLEPREQRSNRLGYAQYAHDDPHGDAERALGADERAEQVGPRVVARERDELAVGQDDVDGEHVVDREAVLEAVRAARVLGDVAADRADLLARRVGRVEEAVAGDRAS